MNSLTWHPLQSAPAGNRPAARERGRGTFSCCRPWWKRTPPSRGSSRAAAPSAWPTARRRCTARPAHQRSWASAISTVEKSLCSNRDNFLPLSTASQKLAACHVYEWARENCWSATVQETSRRSRRCKYGMCYGQLEWGRGRWISTELAHLRPLANARA